MPVVLRLSKEDTLISKGTKLFILAENRVGNIKTICQILGREV